MVEAERRRRRFRTARNIAIGVVALLAVLVLVQVTRGDDDSSSDAGADSASASAVTCSNRKPSSPPKTDTYDAPPAPVLDPATTYEVRMHTSCGDIPIVLDAEQAPETVNSFVSLVQNEFYNGTTFHRIVTDFVDQGGDPTGTGSGGPGYSLPDEPPAGPYRAGDVAMANSGPGTTGSQFFLVVSKDGADQLNATAPAYSILGHMTDDGLKVAKKINTFGSSDGTPTRDIYVFDIGIVFNPSPTTSTAAP
jgi:peptidyl-prolyl cis-trans isomerase B (cyclophilin B)